MDHQYIRRIQLSTSLPEGRKAAFDKIRALMLEAYGKPRNETKNTEGAITTNTVLWVFPSTTITLRTFGPAGLEVTYLPTDDDATP